MRFLFVGGHPKGRTEAFAPDTRSGRVLRSIVRELGLDAEYTDLWETEKQEKEKTISQEKLNYLWSKAEDDCYMVILGAYQANALWSQASFPFWHSCLPHPAARRKTDIDALRNALRMILKEASA